MNNTVFRTTLSWSLFPIAMLITLGLIYHGAYSLDQAFLFYGIATAFVFVLCLFMERMLPYREKWLNPEDDVVTDIEFNIVNLGVGGISDQLVKTALITIFAIYTYNPDLFFTREFWPRELHPLLQLPIAIVAFEFTEYWFHRLAHKYRILWRFHCVHHSSKRLYVLNTFRFHFLEVFIMTLIKSIPIFLLGLGPEIVLLVQGYIMCHAFFQHCNIDVKLGLLNYFCSGPELHRWHHSKVIEESDKNFGNNTIVWDLVFGTYFLPKGRDVGPIGLLNPDFPKGFIRQTATSFSNKKLDKPADYYDRPAYYHELAKTE